MGVVKVQGFGGMYPAIDNTLLRENAAAHSENCWLYSGKLMGFPQPKLVRALTAGTSKVFRIPNDDVDRIDDSTWLEFQNPDTDVVRALIVDDSHDRYYWAASNTAPQYNTLARIKNGDPAWLLGIPQPGSISVSPAGGSSGTTTSRSYLVTWVSAYGEEGPASDPVTVTGKVDDTWKVTLPTPDPNDLGGSGADRNLTKARIYRTVTSSGGVATFFLVDEVDITDSTYDDTKTDTVVASSTQLESTLWTAPPSDLEGFVAMPNGFLAGWRNNELWFSEPYQPHAWPAPYTVVVDYPIVGLGVAGQTLVVCTQGFPVLATGIHPASIAMSKSLSLEPCLSRGSILSTAEGVYYASPNGLVLAGGGVVRVITDKLVTKDKWQSYASVPTLRCARLGSAYLAFGSKRAGSFDPSSFDASSFAQDDFQGSYSGILIDPSDERVAFNLLSAPTPVVNIQNDAWTSEVFIIQDDNLYRVDLSDPAVTRQVYLWRSKIFEAPGRGNLGAMRIYFDIPDTAPDDPGDPPGAGGMLSEFPALPDNAELGVVRLYADGNLVWTREILSSGELMRMPSGFKATYYQFEFETYVHIRSVQIASTAKELAHA